MDVRGIVVPIRSGSYLYQASGWLDLGRRLDLHVRPLTAVGAVGLALSDEVDGVVALVGGTAGAVTAGVVAMGEGVVEVQSMATAGFGGQTDTVFGTMSSGYRDPAEAAKAAMGRATRDAAGTPTRVIEFGSLAIGRHVAKHVGGSSNVTQHPEAASLELRGAALMGAILGGDLKDRMVLDAVPDDVWMRVPTSPSSTGRASLLDAGRSLPTRTSVDVDPYLGGPGAYVVDVLEGRETFDSTLIASYRVNPPVPSRITVTVDIDANANVSVRAAGSDGAAVSLDRIRK